MMEPNARANVIAALITSAQQSGSLDQLLQTGTLQTLFGKFNSSILELAFIVMCTISHFLAH